ncbi:hypothetical protein [Micromonospora sp. NPDC092111]|uniref:hypothetical protein n=1 Tax=Micromonospora sp. NPDC092111 TaxID=3364289 RepID=UPI00380E589C
MRKSARTVAPAACATTMVLPAPALAAPDRGRPVPAGPYRTQSAIDHPPGSPDPGRVQDLPPDTHVRVVVAVRGGPARPAPTGGRRTR